MRIHYLQHVPFENLGSIEHWINKKNFSLSTTKLYEDSAFPNLNDFDWLIVMGGPMGAYEEDKYPWLRDEKIFIKNAIASNKIVLGICLGSQLIAEALGSKVFPNKEKEIGWFPVKLTQSGKNNKIFDSFPEDVTVLHWHGDTFDLPGDAEHLAESSCTKNQAFVFNKAIGLQFHLEVDEPNLKKMIKFGKADLISSQFVQTKKEILESTNHIKKNNEFMIKLLENILEIF